MIELACLRGDALGPLLPALGRLRAEVFRDWPYLYDGDPAYEARYLATYARSPRAAAFVAFDGATPVGVSTCIPLTDETPNIVAPFAAAGIAPPRVFYFGESVLLPGYRGQGLGVRFFQARESHASATSICDITAFCAVQRDAADPRRPDTYAPLDSFWHRRGYVPRLDLACTIAWKEIGHDAETDHRLMFWLRG